jgi:hypothetical protein
MSSWHPWLIFLDSNKDIRSLPLDESSPDIPIIMNQPVIYENCLRILLGDRIYTQEYCPPARGYSEHNSAIEYATQRETQHIPTQPHTITGGPPALTPATRTPPRADQLSKNWLTICFGTMIEHDIPIMKTYHDTIENENPSIPM